MSGPIAARVGGSDGPRTEPEASQRMSSRVPAFDVMLLSPRAGGAGLTLTAADHVIRFLRGWNPAVEDQCTDRIYRIGQSREVHVYYPLAVHPEAHLGEHSFDRKLRAFLADKRELSREMLMPSATPMRYFGTRWERREVRLWPRGLRCKCSLGHTRQ